MNAILIASLHFIGISLATGGIYSRWKNLQQQQWSASLQADNIWGLSAFILIGTGLLRAFTGLEKGGAYYLGNPFFHLKMGLFGLIFLLELWPMTRLIQARIRHETALPESQYRIFAHISLIQMALLVLVIVCATAMARGMTF